MRKNYGKLTDSDKNVIRNSQDKEYILAMIYKCSVSTIRFYRNKGIWRKSKIKEVKT